MGRCARVRTVQEVNALVNGLTRILLPLTPAPAPKLTTPSGASRGADLRGLLVRSGTPRGTCDVGSMGKPSSLLHAAYAMTTPVSLDRTRSVRMPSGRSIIHSTYVLTMAPVSTGWRTAPPVRRAARAPGPPQ